MEEVRIKFGAFRQETGIRRVRINYSKLTRQRAEARKELGDNYRRVRVTRRDLGRILAPYIGARFSDQLRAVLPLTIYLVAFQTLVLHQGVAEPWVILGGMIATVLGLMLFMEGLRVGLMPFGEAIGHALPRQSSLPVVLAVAFVLGVGVTYAEPAIGALRTAGSLVKPDKAPYLYALLNDWSQALVLVVGLGVGVAAILGMLMFIRNWSLKPLVFLTMGTALALTTLLAQDPHLEAVIALAWDCGAVTTGPVTVPLVLALGIGVASAAGKGESSTAGFGIVTLASIFPIIAVLILAMTLRLSFSPEEIVSGAGGVAAASWLDATPWSEILGGLRAIVPLVAFLFLVARYIARTEQREPEILVYGIVLCVIGMIVFNLGLTFGLAKLGGQSGGLVPAAFMEQAGIADSPIFSFGFGLFVALAFAWALGFGATIAEPALNALGNTVETLTNGAFRKSMLIHAVSLGVACGIALGVLKLVFGLPLVWFLVPGYFLALTLTFFSTEEYVNVAWDSAGVTTGPVTVPLVLAMGLGFGNAVGAVEGFGILAMASLGPILAVLSLGLIIRLRARKVLAQPPLAQNAALAAAALDAAEAPSPAPSQ